MKFITTLMLSYLFFGALFSQELNLFSEEIPFSEVEAFAPGKTYHYDIGEKDDYYHKSDCVFVFNTVTKSFTFEQIVKFVLNCNILNHICHLLL